VDQNLFRFRFVNIGRGPLATCTFSYSRPPPSSLLWNWRRHRVAAHSTRRRTHPQN